MSPPRNLNPSKAQGKETNNNTPEQINFNYNSREELLREGL